ncbi:MAG: HTH-type transcriptional activator CmpR [Bacteroidota bacterium]|jgi:DNA-binding transcriptional LysR family regulator
MNYTLNQLQIFLKIVQTQSVTKAAEELHLTQPAVSIQLKNFQEQFEIPLTEVIGRKIYITAFGREVAESVENILEQVQDINFKTMAYKGQLSGRLTICTVSTGKYVLPYFISDFLKIHPGIELIMDVTNKYKVVESLTTNEVDFALVSILPKTIQTEHLNLLQNKLFLIGKEPISIEKNQSVKEFFKTLPLIFREPGSGTRQIMENFIVSNDIKVYKKMELTSNEAVKQAILAGFGFSIMPLIGIKRELLNKELHIIPLEGLPIISTWQLIWLKGKKHGPISLSLMTYMEKEKENIVNKIFSWHENY